MEGHSSDAPPGDSTADSFAWLNERTGERALKWVRAQNARTEQQLTTDPRFKRYYDLALGTLRAKANIPGADGFLLVLYQGSVYSTLRDDAHPRGVWRRTPLESFRTASPKWETLIDFDSLTHAQGQHTELHHWRPLGRRCMLLIMGPVGLEHAIWREFDLDARDFVTHGFVVPAGHSANGASSVVWMDEDTLLISGNFGLQTLGRSGDPLVVKKWRRGTPLSDATEVFRSRHDEALHAGVTSVTNSNGLPVTFAVTRDQKSKLTFWRMTDAKPPERTMLPSGWVVGVLREDLIFANREDWIVGTRIWKADSLLSIPLTDITIPAPRVRLIKAPVARETLSYSHQVARTGVLVSSYVNARGRMERFTKQANKWQGELVPIPDHGSFDPRPSEIEPTSDTALIFHQGFLQPLALYEVDVARNRATRLKSLTPQFDAARFVVEQLEAISRDGTRVPYFLVRPKNLSFDGQAPALLHSYGSNGGGQYPHYDAVLGRLWLEQGGTYVAANIRGGDEFGRTWHVRGAQRQKTYEDFFAVAEDLIHRKITSPRRLGIHGFSAGGLLVAVSITQRPDLFNAAVLEVAITDQLLIEPGHGEQPRKPHEYGPYDDPEVMAFLKRTSPFQNLRNAPEFPVPFIATSTTDDDVHPMHPRRFAAKMQRLGMPYFFYETEAGGHGIATIPEDRARYTALLYTYLAQRLIDSPESGQPKHAIQ